MARPAPALGTALLLVATCAAAAHAVDHVVADASLTLRHTGDTGGSTLVLRDGALPVPAAGSPDDPSAVGLVLTLFGRGSGERAALVAAPGIGRPGWTVRAAPRVTYRYADPGAAPGSAELLSVALRAGAPLRIRARASGLTLGAPEGAVAVRVEIGDTRICALLDGAAVRRDRGGRFSARSTAASGLASCDDDALAGATCEQSASCGGTCPGDAVCGGMPGLGCSCVSPHQPCGDSWPVCNGECPDGEACGDLGGTPYSSCGCLPIASTPCGTVYPSCGDGDCPTGTSCLLETFTCCGGVTIQNCACRTGPPPPACPGGCPDGWTCVGPVPGMPAFCLPPTCSGGSVPSCDGTCSEPGAECTAIGGFGSCLCLTPCSGGDPAPACGGTCPQPGWSCVAAVDQCVCVPPA